MGFGGDKADRLRRGLTVRSRPECTSALKNIQTRVVVAIVNQPAALAHDDPLRERDRLDVAAAVHTLRCGLEPWNLHKQAAVFLAEPRLLEQIVTEPEVANLTPPQRVHPLQVQILERQGIELNRQVVSCRPMPCRAPICDAPMQIGQTVRRLPSRSTSLALSRECPIRSTDFPQTTFERLGSHELLAPRQCEKALQSKIRACGYASLDQRWWLRNCRTPERYIVAAGMVPADRDRLERAENFTRLIKSITAALEAQLARREQLPARQFQRQALWYLRLAPNLGGRLLSCLNQASQPRSSRSVTACSA